MLPVTAAFLITLAVYVTTLEPTVFWLDSGIYLATVHCFGIAFPPGFPLYTLLAKVWSSIPIGTFAWRVNLLSAVFGALACAFVAHTLNRMLEQDAPDSRLADQLVALAAGLALGFSELFWSQALNAEVYSLHACLMAMVLYFLAEISRANENSDFAAPARGPILGLAATAGLAFANHPAALGVLLPCAGLLWFHRSRLRARLWRKALVLFLLSALVPYLYIPFRATVHPPMNFGNPSTPTTFLRHVTASQWTAGKRSKLNLSRFPDTHVYAARLALKQFSAAGCLLALIGAMVLWRRNRRLFWLCALLLEGAVAATEIYSTGEAEDWLLPAYAVLCLWMGLGARAALRRLAQRATVLAAVACLAAVSALGMRNYPRLDRSRNFMAEDYARNLLRNLPQNSVLLLSGDNPLSTISFLQLVLGERPDVAAIQKDSLQSAWVREQNSRRLPPGVSLPQWRCPERAAESVLVSCGESYVAEFVRANARTTPFFEILPDPIPGFELVPAGIGYRLALAPAPQPEEKYWDFVFRSPELSQSPSLQHGYNDSMVEVLNGYIAASKNLADWKLSKREFEPAARQYERALSLYAALPRYGGNMEPGPRFQLANNLAIANSELGQYESALAALDQAEAALPASAAARINRGIIYEKSGRRDLAAAAYWEALQREPDNKQARAALLKLGAPPTNK